MAFKGWPLAQCQSRSTPLLTQLRAGVRVLDIRLSLYNGALGTAHDVLPMGTRFVAVLADLRNFLTHDGVHETVVVSIKQEDGRRTPAHLFSAAVRREILAHDAGLGGWFLEHRIPTLGEVRGRAVLFARFGDDDGAWGGRLGIHPRAWPDSAPEGFAWRCAGTPVRVHDWYRVPTFLSIPEKLRRATRVLCPDAWADADEDVRPAAAWRRYGYAPLYTAELPVPRTDALGIAFLSASAIPFALPPTIARGFGWPRFGLGVEGVNARFTRWCLRKLAGSEDSAGRADDVGEAHSTGARRCNPRIRGWVLMDFVAEPSDMVSIMIELNWRGRVVGEEGWITD
jgi:1-phosphatidylinositol phosphodiesterase